MVVVVVVVTGSIADDDRSHASCVSLSHNLTLLRPSFCSPPPSSYNARQRDECAKQLHVSARLAAEKKAFEEECKSLRQQLDDQEGHSIVTETLRKAAGLEREKRMEAQAEIQQLRKELEGTKSLLQQATTKLRSGGSGGSSGSSPRSGSSRKLSKNVEDDIAAADANAESAVLRRELQRQKDLVGKSLGRACVCRGVSRGGGVERRGCGCGWVWVMVEGTQQLVDDACRPTGPLAATDLTHSLIYAYFFFFGAALRIGVGFAAAKTNGPPTLSASPRNSTTSPRSSSSCRASAAPASSPCPRCGA